jgi:putative ABC transport system permease protein
VGRTARIFVGVIFFGGLAAIAAIAAIEATPRLQDPAYVHPHSLGPVIQPRNGGRVLSDPPVTPDSASEILLSRQLMTAAGVRVGDVVTLAADANGTRARSFRIGGTYEPIPDPRKFSAKRLEARLHLPDLVALASDPGDPESGDLVSAVNLSLTRAEDASDVRAAIARRIPGITAASTSAVRRDDPFAVLEQFHWAIAVVTVTGSTAFLLALMVMRAEERRAIIGVLRLIGVSSRSILLEVLLEGLFVAVAGAAFGVLVAASAQDIINRFFQWRYDTTLVFVRVTGRVVLEAVAFSVPLGVIAGLTASWTLLRRDVVSLVGR